MHQDKRGQSTGDLSGRETQFSFSQSLRDFLEVLSPRTKDIVSSRFGLSGGKAKTLEEIGKEYGVTREQLRKDADKQKPKAGRPKSFVFAFRPATKAFNLRLQFNKRNASKDEVISALEEIIKEIKKSK